MHLLFRSLPAVVALLSTAAVSAGENPPHSPSQPPTLSLQEVLRQAQQHSPVTATARAEAQAARSRAEAAGGLMEPMLRLEHGRTRSLEESMMTGWMLDQSIPFPGKRGAEERAAAALALAAGHDYEQIQLDTLSRVAQTYYRIYESEQAIRINGESRQLAQRIVQWAQAKLAGGRGTLSEVLLAQMEESRLSAEAETLRRERSAGRTMLIALAGLESLPDVPTEPPIDDYEADLEDFRRTVREWLPALKAESAREAAAQAELEGAQRSGWPDFSLGVGYTEESAMEGSERRWIGTVGLSLPIRWDVYAARKGAALAEREAARHRRRAEETLRIARITELHAELGSALQSVRLHREVLLPQARRMLEPVLSEYRTGKAGLERVIEAERALRDLEMGYESARARFGRVLADVQCCLGLPIEAAPILPAE